MFRPCYRGVKPKGKRANQELLPAEKAVKAA
jgi:hypothetical protein